MNKIKLGVSAGLAGAAVYFLGAISLIPAFLLAGYILLFEDNDWLKYQAVKAIVIVVAFGAINIGLQCIDNVFCVINQIVSIVVKNADIHVPFGLTEILTILFSMIRNVLLVLSGISALNFKTIYAGGIDDLVSKNM